MPRYNLKCSECEFEHSIRQSIKESLPEECPECGKPALKPLLVGIQTVACTGMDVADRASALAKKDIRRLKRGKDKDLIDIAGDNPNTLKK